MEEFNKANVSFEFNRSKPYGDKENYA
jgi:hypothetical protein